MTTSGPTPRHGWFARLSVGGKLSLGFALLVAITLAVVLVGYGAADRAAGDIEKTVAVRAPVAATSDDARTGLLRLLGAVQGYLALGETAYRDDYATALGALRDDLGRLEQLLEQSSGADPAEIGEADTVRARVDRVQASLTQLEPLVDELFAIRDDQLVREPALRLLIEDAGPLIGRSLGAAGELMRLESERAPSSESLQRLSDLGRFQSSFLSSVAGLRGYVTTGRQLFRYEFDAGTTAADAAWDDVISARRVLSEDEQSLVAVVDDAREQLDAVVADMLDIIGSDQARVDLYRQRTELVPLAGAMLTELEALADQEADRFRAELSSGSDALGDAVVTFVGFGLLAVLVAMVLALLTWRAISPPIRRLTQAARRVGSGDLDTRAAVESADEIGELASTFNHMTGRLESTVGELRDTNEAQAEYIEQVKLVTDAAESVEADAYELDGIDGVARREDALGVLARTFQRMAREVRAREERLRAQVRELRIEIDEARQTEQVAEITDTDYFRSLRDRADQLRGIVRDDGDGETGSTSTIGEE